MESIDNYFLGQTPSTFFQDHFMTDMAIATTSLSFALIIKALLLNEELGI